MEWSMEWERRRPFLVILYTYRSGQTSLFDAHSKLIVIVSYCKAFLYAVSGGGHSVPTATLYTAETRVQLQPVLGLRDPCQKC